MNQDNLEQFIQDQRSEFDTESPSGMVWMNMERALDSAKQESKPTKMFSIMRVMQVAAMFIVVLSAGMIIGLQVNKSPQVTDNPELLELNEIENYYAKEVNFMLQNVKESGLPEESIKEDLNQLDAIYNELKSDLMKNPNVNTDVVINAMLSNYKAKTEILETVLEKYKANNTNNKINIEDDKVKI